jgi:erythromycin esterase
MDATTVRVIVPCVAILTTLPFGAASAQERNADARMQWLAAHAAPIATIQPVSDDFADLEPFRQAVGDARVVMLGEQSHGDGATFLAKTRLIEFLHREMGFDVLVFESGLYDCRKAWDLLRHGEDAKTAAARCLFDIWSNSQQVQPLLDYLDTASRTDHPLELAGFDMQPNGSASRDFLLADLTAFVTRHDTALAAEPAFHSVSTTIEMLFTNPAAWRSLPPEDRAAFRRAVATVRERLVEGSLPGDTAAFWAQQLKSLGRFCEFAWGLNPRQIDPAIANMRDEQMADNLTWLATHQYPTRRLIVWGATSHLIRNRQTIANNGAPNMIPMGHHLLETLGDDVYTVMFTSYTGRQGAALEGARGAAQEIGEAPPGSLEDLFNRTGYEYAFLDLRRLPAGGEWLRDSLTGLPLGHAPMAADWTRVADALFFIREMRPSRVVQ